MQLTQQFLSPLEFKFNLARLPKTNFMVQRASVPSLSLSSINQPTPFHTPKRTGHTLSFGDFSIVFKVDEDLTNYMEIFAWMHGLGFPESTDNYKNLVESPFGDYSDGSLIIMSSQKNPSVMFTLENMFPISLSSLEFDTTQDDVTYMDCTVDFSFDRFRIERLRTD